MESRFKKSNLNQELDKLGIDAGKNQLEQIISQVMNLLF